MRTIEKIGAFWLGFLPPVLLGLLLGLPLSAGLMLWKRGQPREWLTWSAGLAAGFVMNYVVSVILLFAFNVAQALLIGIIFHFSQ